MMLSALICWPKTPEIKSINTPLIECESFENFIDLIVEKYGVGVDIMVVYDENGDDLDQDIVEID